MLLTFCINSVLVAQGALSGGHTTADCIADKECTRLVLSRIQTRMGELDYTAGLAAATVECFRAAFDEPSYVLPFLEPFMPFYDAIRHDPEFVELMAEIDPEQ
jgi:hypothetical protein